MQISLPQPDTGAIAHSQALHAHIKQMIQQKNGWISFAEFMQLALYAPGLGYYSGGAKKFGAQGDFVTAPEISSLFSRTIAHQAAQVLAALKLQSIHGNILELGAGTGRLAKDMLLELANLNQLPQQYFILEVSAHLRVVQRETLQASLSADLVSRVIWLESLPAEFDGFIFGNEVLDALPVHLIKQNEGVPVEVGVAEKVGDAGDAGFVWQEAVLQDLNLQRFVEQLHLSDGYLTEICPLASALMASLASILRHGALIMIDYGFSRQEYYHPQRRQGTLMCHYRHHSHSDPFAYLGLQDITAHVDFTRIAEAGVVHGLTLEGFLTQAQFLLNAGITDLLQEVPADDLEHYLPAVTASQKLLSPAEMGELFKVIGFKKNLELPLLGFSTGDKTHTL